MDRNVICSGALEFFKDCYIMIIQDTVIISYVNMKDSRFPYTYSAQGVYWMKLKFKIELLTISG